MHEALETGLIKIIVASTIHKPCGQLNGQAVHRVFEGEGLVRKTSLGLLYIFCTQHSAVQSKMVLLLIIEHEKTKCLLGP